MTSPFALCAVFLTAAAAVSAQPDTRKLQIEVRDDAGQLLPCRIHLTDSAGKPQQHPRLPFWRDHFVSAGQANLDLPPGKYRYEIERGLEYRPATGSVDFAIADAHALNIKLDRIANLAGHRWFSGDLHVHRPLEDIPLLMQTEDLHIAPVITWWNRTNPWKDKEAPPDVLRRFDTNRLYHIMAGEDERGGGAVLFFHLPRPIDMTAAAREDPTALSFIRDARRANPNVWIDIEKPFWWDVPLWLAQGNVNSIGIAHNHMWRSGVLPNEAWGRRRDTAIYPDPQGNGHWTQSIYYHLLNCGLRLPPSAGSASGVLPNPVGHNRVYVHIDGDLDWDKWWAGLRQGNCFVTNGPLLLAKANNEIPGHVFLANERLDLQLEAQLSSNDPIARVEVIKNGEVVSRLNQVHGSDGQLTGKLAFDESGWFLIRAFADALHTFRFASTAPFYVEIANRPQKISRKSAQFFLGWSQERRAMLEKALPQNESSRQVLAEHETAIQFWRNKLSSANAE